MVNDMSVFYFRGLAFIFHFLFHNRGFPFLLKRLAVTALCMWAAYAQAWGCKARSSHNCLCGPNNSSLTEGKNGKTFKLHANKSHTVQICKYHQVHFHRVALKCTFYHLSQKIARASSSFFFWHFS